MDISGLTIANGSVSGGGTVGGGVANAGRLTITSCTFSGNRNNGNGGGGIYNSGGTVTLTNSVLSGNSASLGGGIYSTGTVTFSTSDPGPGVVLPADYTFTLADGGVHTFTDTGLGETTLVTRGFQTLTVTDTADGSIIGSATVKVRHVRHHAALDRFFAALGSADFGLLSSSSHQRRRDGDAAGVLGIIDG